MTGTEMLKVLWPSQVQGILQHGVSSIAGPVVRAADLHSTDPAAVVRAWGWHRLAPYGNPPAVVDVLRFPVHPLMRMSNPNDAGVGHVPSYVHGFLPGDGAIVPVFDLARTRVPTGAELWRLRAEGEPGLKLIYDGPAHGWRRAPSYFPPLHIVGPRAVWRGLDLPAAFMPDTRAVELVHVGDAVPEGFEAVRPQVSRVIVPVTECESLFEAVLTASWRGHGARILQRAGDEALLELPGLAPEVAKSVGATLVEPGLHEIVVPFSELTDVDGVTYERDAGPAGRDVEHP